MNINCYLETEAPRKEVPFLNWQSIPELATWTSEDLDCMWAPFLAFYHLLCKVLFWASWISKLGRRPWTHMVLKKEIMPGLTFFDLGSPARVTSTPLLQVKFPKENKFIAHCLLTLPYRTSWITAGFPYGLHGWDQTDAGDRYQGLWLLVSDPCIKQDIVCFKEEQRVRWSVKGHQDRTHVLSTCQVQ